MVSCINTFYQRRQRVWEAHSLILVGSISYSISQMSWTISARWPRVSSTDTFPLITIATLTRLNIKPDNVRLADE